MKICLNPSCLILGCAIRAGAFGMVRPCWTKNRANLARANEKIAEAKAILAKMPNPSEQ